MKYGLKASTLENIIKTFTKQPKIKRVVLYGSRAKGNYRTGSDIDITLMGENITMEDLNRIYLELDELCLPYNFDISVFEKLENKDLIDHINRIGTTIYENDSRGQCE